MLMTNGSNRRDIRSLYLFFSVYRYFTDSDIMCPIILQDHIFCIGQWRRHGMLLFYGPVDMTCGFEMQSVPET